VTDITKLKIDNNIITPTGVLSILALTYGISTVNDLLLYTRDTNYGRNTHRIYFEEVLIEARGTCSTKHGLIKQIAIEQQLDDIHLVACIFNMNAANTPAIAATLEGYHLDYIPEMHCYIEIGKVAIDLTFKDSDLGFISDDIMQRQYVQPGFLDTEKVKVHRAYIDDWIEEQSIPYTADQVWSIREQCIKALSV
jgi:hypothetical protein